MYKGGKGMDKNPLIKECLTVGIILVLLGVCMIPSTAQDTKKPSSISSSSCKVKVMLKDAGGATVGNNVSGFFTIQPLGLNNKRG